jgi:hypothetical protein
LGHKLKWIFTRLLSFAYQNSGRHHSEKTFEKISKAIPTKGRTAKSGFFYFREGDTLSIKSQKNLPLPPNSFSTIDSCRYAYPYFW